MIISLWQFLLKQIYITDNPFNGEIPFYSLKRSFTNFNNKVFFNMAEPDNVIDNIERCKYKSIPVYAPIILNRFISTFYNVNDMVCDPC